MANKLPDTAVDRPMLRLLCESIYNMRYSFMVFEYTNK